jgi:hypothetical protein
MDHATEKRAEHAEDSIAFPSDSPPPPSAPSPSRRQEQNLSQISPPSIDNKHRCQVFEALKNLKGGESGSAPANKTEWSQRTQMFDLKDDEIPEAERSIRRCRNDIESDTLVKRVEEEKLAKAADFYPDKENRDENTEARLNGIEWSKLYQAENGRRRKHRGGKRVKKKHAKKTSDRSATGHDVETSLEEAVINERSNKTSGVEMVDGREDHKQKDKKRERREERGQEDILESNQHEPAASVPEAIDRTTFVPEGKIETKRRRRKNEKPMSCQEMQEAGNAKKGRLPRTSEQKDAKRAARLERKIAAAVTRFGTDEELLAAKLAHEQHLSKLEEVAQ